MTLKEFMSNEASERENNYVLRSTTVSVRYILVCNYTLCCPQMLTATVISKKLGQVHLNWHLLLS